MLLEPMCLTHVEVKYVLSLNKTGHICVYLLLTSPGYSQSIPRTSLHKKCFNRVSNSHPLIYLVLYPDNFPHTVSEPKTSSATTPNVSTYEIQWFLSIESPLHETHVIDILKST